MHGAPRYHRRKPGSSTIGILEQAESDLERDVLQLLGYLGVMAESTHDTRSRQPKEYAGRSDISGILPGGRALRLELKKPGGKPTHEQLAYLARARDHGAVAFWADDLETVRLGVTLAMKKGPHSGPL
jgi:hypothetical protein